MTEIPVETEPQAAKPERPTGMELLRQIAVPLNEDQIRELQAKLASGWNPLEIAPPPLAARPKWKPTGEPRLSLADMIFAWFHEHEDSYLKHVNLTPRASADAALEEFLNPPCPPEELLKFLRSFAATYERLLRDRVVQSALSPEKHSSVTSLAFAGQHPDIVHVRLDRLSALAEKSPAGADLFRLSEFAGCSAQELAKYLKLPADEVQRQIKRRHFDICVSTATF